MGNFTEFIDDLEGNLHEYKADICKICGILT